jgi:hypothetical protein
MLGKDDEDEEKHKQKQDRRSELQKTKHFNNDPKLNPFHRTYKARRSKVRKEMPEELRMLQSIIVCIQRIILMKSEVRTNKLCRLTTNSNYDKGKQ